MPKKPKVTMTSFETGETTSLRKYVSSLKEGCFPVSHIIGKKILSKSQLEEAVLSGSLQEVLVSGGKYINKTDLYNFLKKDTSKILETTQRNDEF